MFRAYKHHPSVIGYRHASHGRGASSERFNNDLGQLTDVTETRGGLTFTTAYTYDLAGNVLTITLDSGRVITYSRNANGLVSGVSGTVVGSGTVQFSSAVNYLPFGPVTGMTYGNGLTFSATYDQDYNPTNRTVSGGLYNLTYDTDDVGNITQIGTPTFGYDALNRLNAETPGSISYTYDATSNRLTKVSGGTTTSTVPSGSNKISAVGGSNITYNSAGAFTSYGSTAYNWNATGQISFISTSGSTVGTYTYNASNQRTKKVAGGNTVHYVYGLGGLLYGEYDGSGTLIREYVYQNDAPLAQIDAGSPEVLTYLHTDHLGTPKYGTNSGGTSVWSANTDPFGVGTPSGSRTVNLRMAGQYYDSESGLFYNWNRYYHPALGRYISSDPIGLAGGPNTFNYANVSPVMFTDPLGLFATYEECMGTYLLSGAAVGATVGVATGPGSVVAVPGGALVGSGVGLLAGSILCPFSDLGTIFNSDETESATSGQGCTGDCPSGNTPEGLLGGARDVDTRGKVTQGTLSGGQPQADKDFDGLLPEAIKDQGGGMRSGVLPDGRKVVVRPTSDDGRPTLEVQDGKNVLKLGTIKRGYHDFK